MSESEADNAPSAENSPLGYKIFLSFLTNTQTRLAEEEFLLYATNELSVPKEKVDEFPPLKEELPVILIAFINMWSGWDSDLKRKCISGEIPKDLYFRRFQDFMKSKLSSTMKIISKANRENKTWWRNFLANKQDFAASQIVVKGPPVLLNTVVFGCRKDDVLMKLHDVPQWKNLNMFHLLNWPFVEVLFETPDVSLVRRHQPEHVRYISSSLDIPATVKEDPIESVTPLGVQDCYSVNYIETYFEMYLNTLRNCKISQSLFLVAQTTIHQFLQDVKYLKLPSVATMTKIVFQMSPTPFIRTKQVIQKADTERDPVICQEIIYPKTEFCVLKFEAKQTQDRQSFESIEIMRRHSGRKQDTFVRKFVEPSIRFRCIYCPSCNFGIDSIIAHVREEHGMACDVKCLLCKETLSVTTLAVNRWGHKCQ